MEIAKQVKMNGPEWWGERAKTDPPRCPIHESVMVLAEDGWYRCDRTKTSTSKEICTFYAAAAHIPLQMLTNNVYEGDTDLAIIVKEGQVHVLLMLPQIGFMLNVTHLIDVDAAGGGMELNQKTSDGKDIHRLHLGLSKLIRLPG